MHDGRSPAYLAGLQTPAMRSVHPSLNNVASAVVVGGVAVGVVRIVVSVVVPVAIRPVAVAVPVVVAMKSSNNGTGAKTVEAATSTDGTGAPLEPSSEAAAVKTAAAHGHAAAVEATATKAATTVSAATTATTATAAASTATSACLRARRQERPGKQVRCQYHRCSSCSH